MSKSIQLSHSAVNKYNECSEKYRLHYIEKLRTKFCSSALFFGSACDRAFERHLIEKKDTLTNEEKSMLNKTAIELFDEQFSKATNAVGELDIAKSEYAQYFNSDIDVSLLTQDDLLDAQNWASELGFEEIDVDTFISDVKDARKAKKPLSEDETKLFNYICWMSLRRKGHILVEAYKADIMPHILKVHSIQERVELTEGKHKYIGFIDFTAEFVDEPGVVYVCDNKTSSMAYSEDSVKESGQLASYCEWKGVDKAAYVVVEKKLRKRNPRHRTQIVRDEIPEETYEKVFDNVGEVLYNVEQQVFEKKEDSKDCFFFGRKCDYFNKCWKDNPEGLVKKR